MTDCDDAFPYSIEQEIIWRDMDAFQHVNNAVYFRYFEDVRMGFFEEIGAIQYGKTHQIGPILATTRCDYRAPLEFPGRIRIGTHIEDIKPKRFTMKYAVFSESLGRVAAEGEALLVYSDYAASACCEIPELIREKLQRLVR
jgi:acyl-CoA thioester hydrolase